MGGWEREGEFTALLAALQQKAKRAQIEALAQLAVDDHKTCYKAVPVLMDRQLRKATGSARMHVMFAVSKVLRLARKQLKAGNKLGERFGPLLPGMCGCVAKLRPEHTASMRKLLGSWRTEGAVAEATIAACEAALGGAEAGGGSASPAPAAAAAANGGMPVAPAGYTLAAVAAAPLPPPAATTAAADANGQRLTPAKRPAGEGEGAGEDRSGAAYDPFATNHSPTPPPAAAAAAVAGGAAADVSARRASPPGVANGSSQPWAQQPPPAAAAPPPSYLLPQGVLSPTPSGPPPPPLLPGLDTAAEARPTSGRQFGRGIKLAAQQQQQQTPPPEPPQTGPGGGDRAATKQQHEKQQQQEEVPPPAPQPPPPPPPGAAAAIPGLGPVVSAQPAVPGLRGQLPPGLGPPPPAPSAASGAPATAATPAAPSKAAAPDAPPPAGAAAASSSVDPAPAANGAVPGLQQQPQQPEEEDPMHDLGLDALVWDSFV